MAKIVVGINTLTVLDRLAYINHINLFYRLGKKVEHQIILVAPPRCTIDRMRNMTAKVALEQNADYILFIDDDVIVPLNTVERLIAADADIAAGWTIIRGWPFENMFFKYTEERHLKKYQDFVLNERGLIECDAVGFSCCLIKVSLLKDIPPAYFVTGTHNTEDIYFCIKARQYKPDCTIVVDPEVKTAHIVGVETISPLNRDIFKNFYREQYPEECMDAVEPVDHRGDDYLKAITDPNNTIIEVI